MRRYRIWSSALALSDLRFPPAFPKARADHGSGQRLWPVLSRCDGGGGLVHPLDPADRARVVVRQHAIQRPSTRRAAHVADAAVEAPEGAGTGRYHRNKADWSE